MKQAPDSILLQIQKDWLANSWDLKDLERFTMNGDGAGNGGGSGSGGEGGGGAGGDGGNGNGGGNSGGSGGDGSGGNKKDTFTQAEVDRIAAREKDQGKRAAEEAIAKQLGVTVEEAKKIISDAKAAEDAKKDDATKAREAADAAKADADKEKAEAAKARTEAAVERALIRALPKDLDDDALDKRVTRLNRLIDVEVGADAAAIKTAVDALKEDMPELFNIEAGNGGGGGGGGKPKPPNGDPKGKPKGGGKQEDAYARGAERAKTSTSGGYAILGNQA